MKKVNLKLRFPPEWGIEPVPKDAKMLRGVDTFVLWFSVGIGLLVIQAGAFLTLPVELGGFGLSLPTAFLISIAGSFIGSIVLSLAGIIGSREGVTSMVSLRPAFGLSGSYFLSFLNIILCIGWTIFEIVIMGEAATTISGNFIGTFTKYMWFVFFALLAFFMASSGPLTVVRQWLEKFAVWLALGGAILVTYNIFHEISTTALIRNAPQSVQFSSILLALDLVIAMPVSWLPLISDYNRFVRKERESFFGTLLGYTTANTWFYFLGAMLAVAYPKQTITYSMAILPLGLFGLFLILADEPDNTFADVYSATLSIQNILPGKKQRRIALIIALLSLLIACLIPIVQYENFLLLIGASFVPVFGVIFSDYFLKNKGRYSEEQLYPVNPCINWRAIIAWAIGFLTYYYFAYINIIFGATFPSLIVAFGLYTILSSLKGGKNKT